MINVRLWFLLLVNLAIISAVASISCWDCNSYINAGCGDPFRSKNFEPKNCSHPDVNIHKDKFGEPKLCRKIIQKVDDEVRIIRDCGWLDDDKETTRLGPGECVKRSGTFSVLIEYCSCTKDNCNHGYSLLSSSSSLSLLITISMPFIYIFYHIYL